MLEQKDLEMIAEVVSKTVEPIRKEVVEIKEGLRETKEEVRGLKEGLEETREEVRELRESLEETNKRVEKIEKDIKNIFLMLENETNHNIRIIAEGHLDLSRKLDDALSVENEKEILLIRVNILEGEVKRLKERIESIA